MTKILNILLVLLYASRSLQEVCISQDRDNKVPHYCKTVTINQFCQDADNISNDTFIIILNGTHNLNSVCEIKKAENITLKGANVTINCSYDEDNGFQFFDVFTLEIANITFIGCGAKWTTTQPQLFGLYPDILSALLFVNGSDLTLTNVTVLDAKSAGIYIYNVAGNVAVDSCEVTGAFSHKPKILSGNVIVYDSLFTEEAKLSMTDSKITNSGAQIDSSREECIFSNGLALFLGSSELEIEIEKTNFSQNKGCKGGNIAVSFYDFASVTILNSDFSRGYGFIGGGIFVSINTLYFEEKYARMDLPFFSEVLSVVNVTITENFARSAGGGVFIGFDSSSKLLNKSLPVDMAILNATFDSNVITGNEGYALSVHKNFNNDPTTVSRLLLGLNISNCTFTNHFPNRESEFPIDNSVIEAQNIVATLIIDGITVKSNKCTALKAIGSNIFFHGSTQISNNTAITGAGIQLSDSLIFLAAHTDLIIVNNSAQQTGGGIQINTYPGCASVLQKPYCFYQYGSNKSLLMTINFTVNYNHASNGGDNIFGSNKLCEADDDILNSPKNTPNEPSSISSNPELVCISVTRAHECSNFENITVFPGQKITVYVHLLGLYQGSVTGTVSVNIIGGASINTTKKAQAVEISGRNITYTIYSSQAHNIPNASLVFQPIKYGCTLAGVEVKSLLRISFSECPFGFTNTKIGTKLFECLCNSNPVISSCSIQSQTITKRKYSWIGMLKLNNHSYLATNDYCPLDYCNSSRQDIKSHSNHLDQNEQCHYNRTGILCGSCPKGWSLVLGSSECREKCSNVWLLLVIPFALLGLLLVVVIHSLSLTVTMGTVCGLIFYANIIQDYSVTFLSAYSIPGITPILRIFLSWLNLDFGITTCFYDGMEAFGKTILLFAFPIYIWLVSAGIIFLSNRYISFTRIVGENALKVLATLFLLSYSKMIRITIGALNLKSVTVHFNNSNSTLSQIRWALDSNIPYFDLQRHLALFIIAILFIMLLLPFSMSLLCIHRVYSLSNYCRVFFWVDRLKPFFDTYTGPYKDNARFWTGLLLFIRMLLLIVHTLDYKDNVIPYYIIIAVCFLLTFLMSLLKGVYKQHGLNTLERFFISNMCAIFLINTYKGGPESWKSISSHLLVSSAFVAFLGILAYHIYVKISHLSFLKKIRVRPHSSYERISCTGMRNSNEPAGELDKTE